MERSKKTILGIDIGGTKIRTFYRGRFREYFTPKNKKDLIKFLKTLPHADAVGIAVAGVIERKKIQSSPNIKYLKNFDFSSLNLGKIKIDNDARAFLKAEAKGLKNVLGITVGTGIGRSFSGKKIKKFEYPESWEKEYQKVRDTGNDEELSKYLGMKLGLIIKKYKPGLIILGGGVLVRKGFFEKLKKELKVRTRKAKYGTNAGALGAAKLWS